jgi:rhodanese-related sulfurtransferase
MVFLELSDSLRSYRETRLIDENTFNICRKEPNTIVLDTRSKKAYDEIHIKGAIHLNFSDFTEEKLKTIIPDKSTRILIYCNNNFESKRPSLFDKHITLALNIPTFINLYGYGYKNVYELSGYTKEEETIIPLEIKTEK